MWIAFGGFRLLRPPKRVDRRPTLGLDLEHQSVPAGQVDRGGQKANCYGYQI